MKKTLLYLTFLIVFMAGVFLIHLQTFPTARPFLINSYIINAFLAIVSLTVLGWGMYNRKSNLALLYMVTVFLKLGVYFMYFRPVFERDGVLTRNEFFVFFVPYAVGLFVEIVYLIRRYNWFYKKSD